MPDLEEIYRMRIVYQLPDMEKIPVHKGITYKTVDGEDLKMDVYYPAGLQPEKACTALIYSMMTIAHKKSSKRHLPSSPHI